MFLVVGVSLSDLSALFSTRFADVYTRPSFRFTDVSYTLGDEAEDAAAAAAAEVVIDDRPGPSMALFRF